MARGKGDVRLFTIAIHCGKCNAFLYKYKKEGPGSLVKCYKDRIVEDATQGDRTCPSCGQEFAREAMIHHRPCHKIIQGKITVKGHCKK